MDSSSAFYKQTKEVFDTENSLDSVERTIALFWSDDPGTCTPPGHSMSILCQCWGAITAKLDFAAKGYALTGMAIADAFISCWATKYKYNLIRPVTVINQLMDSSWATEVPYP